MWEYVSIKDNQLSCKVDTKPFECSVLGRIK